jgi:hypothetical protein
LARVQAICMIAPLTAANPAVPGSAVVDSIRLPSLYEKLRDYTASGASVLLDSKYLYLSIHSEFICFPILFIYLEQKGHLPTLKPAEPSQT